MGWFEAAIAELEPVIEAKLEDHVNSKRYPSLKTLAMLRKAWSIAQIAARLCANNYRLKPYENIQLLADSSNIHSMHEGIKKAFGPNKTKTVLLRASTDWQTDGKMG